MLREDVSEAARNCCCIANAAEPYMVSPVFRTSGCVAASHRSAISSSVTSALSNTIDRSHRTRRSRSPPYWALMHKVACPTLLTWGRDDRVSPPDMALVPMRLIPDAQLHVFPRCGHWVMIEAKEAFEATVLAFLRD